MEKNNEELACDVWMIICLALSTDQLKKVYFFNKNKRPAKAIRLKLEDESKQILRYIPESLTKLILITNTSYPITNQRLF